MFIDKVSMKKRERGSKEANLFEYNSLEELSFDYNSIINFKFKRGNPDLLENKRDSFHGDPPQQVLKDITTGWDVGAKKSQEILYKIEGKLNIDTSAYKTQSSVVGSLVNVGAYLSGNPMCMRMRRKQMENTNPVNLILDVSVSASTNQDEIFNRGVATLALIRVVSRARPVNLKVVTGMTISGFNGIISIPIETAPLDLARASYILSRPEVFRRILFAKIAKEAEVNGKTYEGHIDWLFGDYSWHKEYLVSELADYWGYGNDYLGVAGTVSSDRSNGSRDSVENAANWVIENAKKLLELKDY